MGLICSLIIITTGSHSLVKGPLAQTSFLLPGGNHRGTGSFATGLHTGIWALLARVILRGDNHVRFGFSVVELWWWHLEVFPPVRARKLSRWTPIGKPRDGGCAKGQLQRFIVIEKVKRSRLRGAEN